MITPQNLIQKYDIPGPRYTGYPTVPFWDKERLSYQDWITTTQHSFEESNQSEGISLYIHLPFCERQCTYCDCHKRVTKDQNVQEPYVETVLKEWEMYCDKFPETPWIKEIYLGGGTPTFFSPENLTKLMDGIFQKAEKCPGFEFSFEGHPNKTTQEHLETLYKLGFKRSSFGIQDYDARVQKTINRIQSFESVEEVTNNSRKLGYDSVSHDLVFGLPHQTTQTIVETIQRTTALKPDRIAFNSYTHVPWTKRVGERGYEEKDLPTAQEKRLLYETGKSLLNELGYLEIGMDHFALRTDAMYKAMENKKLHRNSLGYTSSRTKLVIGLGMGSVSDSWYGYAQNVKSLESYTDLVNQGIFPIFRGHLLNGEDLIIRKHIQNIMCNAETSWENEELRFPELESCLDDLSEMVKDGLVEITENGLKIADEARPFIRNVCMAFDLRLKRNEPASRVFSMAI